MNEQLKPLPTPPQAKGSHSPTKPRSKSRSPQRDNNNKRNSNKSGKSPERKQKNRSNDATKRKDMDNMDEDDEDFEFFHEFSREKVKDVIHHITSYLKQHAMDIEYLMIPFRPEQNNEKLLRFLNAIFPMGNGQPVSERSQLKIISKTDVWTLFQSLKYIWCRLPNSEIIGWKAYLQFKYRETEKNFPQKAFLEIMPQCLDSPNQASIVYDFFDLIVTLSSNSKINKMSARKISKMCGIWAFKKSTNDERTTSYDFDEKFLKNGKINNSFQDGLDEWIPASDAMFHLLLAFLKSFVPQDLESSKLPKSLKSILFNNDYPPKGSTAYNSQTILTIPLVTLTTDQFSRKPWQLLEKCNEMLDFSDYDAFEAREDYALLKSLFKKKNNIEGISRKMSSESRRLMKIMSTKHSTFQAGWAPRKCLPNEYNLKEYIKVKRVDIDDYFIWTWLSTLSYEQTNEKKKIFGRSLILEFEFDGFKKWVIFQERDITLTYQSKSQLKNKHIKESEQKKKTKDSKKEIDKHRNVTPVYEKFQNEVPNRSVMKPVDPKSRKSQEQYHTVIGKDVLNKNRKNSLEQKISKWNPLYNLRKKSTESNIDRNTSPSSFELKNEFESSSRYDPPTPNTNNKQEESRIISDFSLLDSDKYKLPEIERDDEGFNINMADIGNTDSQEEKEPPKQDTLEQLSDMVENMLVTDNVNSSEAQQAFENMTKFAQYKPPDGHDFDRVSTASSTVPSLKIANPIESPDPSQYDHQNMITNRNNMNNGANNFQQQVNMGRGNQQPQFQQQMGSPQRQNHFPQPKMQEQQQFQQMQYQGYNQNYPISGPVPSSPARSPERSSPINVSSAVQPVSFDKGPVNVPQAQPYQQMPSQPPAGYNGPNNQSPRQGFQNPSEGQRVTNSISPPKPQPQIQHQNNMNQVPLQGGGRLQNKYSQQPGNATSNMQNNQYLQQQQHQQQQHQNQRNMNIQGNTNRNDFPSQQMKPVIGNPHIQNRSTSPVHKEQSQQIPQQVQGQQLKQNFPMQGQGVSYIHPQQQQQQHHHHHQQSKQHQINGPNNFNQQQQAPNVVRQNQQVRSSSPNRMMPQQQQQGYAAYVHPQNQMNMNQNMNMNMSPSMPQNMNMNMNMNMSPSMPQNINMNMGNMNPNPPPSTIPMAIPHGGMGMKLHGNVANKKQDRKQLYNNIRSGNFGI